MIEVSHAAGSPEQASQVAVEAFGAAVSGSAYEVVGDLFHPAFHHLVERFQGGQSKLPASLAPFSKVDGSHGGGSDFPVFKDPSQLFAVFGQAGQLGEPSLQSRQFLLLLWRKVFLIGQPQPS